MIFNYSMGMALSRGLSLCCILYVLILKLILEVFSLIIVLHKARLSWNIIRTSQRTFLNRYLEFCSSDSRGFAECSSSTDNQQKLDSRFGITLVYISLLAFTALHHKKQGQWDKEHTGNPLSPAIVGQSGPLSLMRNTEHILYLQIISLLFLFSICSGTFSF